MKKNVAAQNIGCQITTASDGTDFAGTVTVYITIDAGAQTLGGTAAGVCTNEGRGYYTYVPTQAETNGSLIAFTFSGTGAITTTVQVYTNFPQTVELSTGITAGTIATVSGNVTGSIGSVAAAGIAASSLATAAKQDIADFVLDRNMATGTDSGTDSTAVRTPRQGFRSLRNKVTIAAGVATVTKEDDVTASWTAAIATTAGNPISGVDPT